MTNFWQGLEEFNKFAEQKNNDIEFRLYYDNDGNPLFYTTEKLEGNFVIIDNETYSRGDYQNIKVKDGKILQKNPLDSAKLVKHDSEGFCCNTKDISIIDETNNGQRWKLKTHEYS